MKKTLLFAVMASSFALTGCVAPKTQWAWNGYNDHLFDYYGQSITGDEYLVFLLAAVDEAEKRNVRLAPGLYAEIGTFYARAGKFEEALTYYELERKTWPESQGFMTALIDGIQRNLKDKNKETLP